MNNGSNPMFLMEIHAFWVFLRMTLAVLDLYGHTRGWVRVRWSQDRVKEKVRVRVRRLSLVFLQYNERFNVKIHDKRVKFRAKSWFFVIDWLWLVILYAFECIWGWNTGIFSWDWVRVMSHVLTVFRIGDFFDFFLKSMFLSTKSSVVVLRVTVFACFRMISAW